MTAHVVEGGQLVFDPRGVVEVEPRPVSRRVATLDGVRLAVLDNTKWNASKLLRATVERLAADVRLGEVRYYRKESFSRNAAPGLIAEMAAAGDIGLTAIGD
jgi:hypothetical protein